MKITIATGIYAPEIGGPATFLRELVPFLQKKGIKIDVVTYGEPRAGVVTIPRDGMFRFLRFLLAVKKSARTSDIIFTTDTFSSGFPAALAAKWLKKRLIVRFVGDSAWEISRSNDWVSDSFDVFQKKKYDFKVELLRKIQKWVLRRGEVITVSEFLQGVLGRWGIRKVTVVRNAVSPVKLPAKTVLKKQFGFDKKFVMLNVGRVTKYKGVDKIIGMCARLRKDIPELLLVVVGDGPALDDARHASMTENLTHVIQFVGKKDENETRKLMRASDVLVLNSEYEGMSHTLLEAISAECPVVASDVGGNVELVKNRGLLFEYNNMDDLREQMLRLYKEPELGEKLVAKAQKGLPSREDVEKAVLKLLGV